MVEKRKLTTIKIVIYCTIFYVLWSIRELIVRPILFDSLNMAAFEIIETLIKLLVWTIPAIILIKHYENDMWISIKEMLSNKVKWIKYIPISIAFLMYYSLCAYFSFGKIAIHHDFIPLTLIGTVLFVGITEEGVFRAWLLNAMLKKMKTWHAVLLNAVLFLLIHFPYWIYLGYFSDPIKLLSSCMGVIILSTIFSWTFIKSKNIFVPIMLHMSWNLFTILFFGS